MKLARAIAFALLLSVCAVPMAIAGAKDGQGYFTIMASYIDDDELAAVDDGVTGGQLGFGRALHPNWNLEGYLSLARPDGLPGQDQTGLGADLQFVFNRGGKFNPYLFLRTHE
jgi:hypothetical protein